MHKTVTSEAQNPFIADMLIIQGLQSMLFSDSFGKVMGILRC